MYANFTSAYLLTPDPLSCTLTPRLRASHLQCESNHARKFWHVKRGLRMSKLPAYIEKAVPNPASKRAPWYKNTAPSYTGIFLWIVFYQTLAEGTLTHAGPWFCFLALAVAGLLCYGLYYYAPAMLGMQTGFPLYVIGSSTFGSA